MNVCQSVPIEEFKIFCSNSDRSDRPAIAIMSGPRSSGKARAGHILAKELGRKLYMADFSRTTEKAIGETEKSLSALIDKAEAANAVLFFDEADAVFGKQTDLREGRHFYPNQELNYLFSLIAKSHCISLLSTVHIDRIAPFIRRKIDYHLDFNDF